MKKISLIRTLCLLNVSFRLCLINASFRVPLHKWPYTINTFHRASYHRSPWPSGLRSWFRSRSIFTRRASILWRGFESHYRHFLFWILFFSSYLTILLYTFIFVAFWYGNLYFIFYCNFSVTSLPLHKWPNTITTLHCASCHWSQWPSGLRSRFRRRSTFTRPSSSRLGFEYWVSHDFFLLFPVRVVCFLFSITTPTMARHGTGAQLVSI